MNVLKGLASLGMALNPPYLGDWPHRIGQYMLNFGAIELISYQHLLFLEPTESDFSKNLDRLLSKRIDRIHQLLNASSRIAEPVRLEVSDLWTEVRELAIWRNRVAHNPVLPTWKPGSDAENAPPDLLGIPDMKQLKASNVSDSITMDGLTKLIDATVNVARRLHETTKKLQAAT